MGEAAWTATADLGSHLYECWCHGRHVDVKLRFILADDSSCLVPAHKVVLERAAYFRALFSGPLASSAASGEEGEVVVRLDDPSITPDAVRACIAFLYRNRLEGVVQLPDTFPRSSSQSYTGSSSSPRSSGQLPAAFSGSSARALVSVLACASVLLCPQLERACVEQLSACATADTVVLLLECGKRYFQSGLESAAMHWLCMNVSRAQDSLLHQLAPSVIAELLSRPELQLNGTQNVHRDVPPPSGLGITSEWGRYTLARRFALAPKAQDEPKTPRQTHRLTFTSPEASSAAAGSSEPAGSNERTPRRAKRSRSPADPSRQRAATRSQAAASSKGGKGIERDESASDGESNDERATDFHLQSAMSPAAHQAQHQFDSPAPAGGRGAGGSGGGGIGGEGVGSHLGFAQAVSGAERSEIGGFSATVVRGQNGIVTPANSATAPSAGDAFSTALRGSAISFGTARASGRTLVDVPSLAQRLRLPFEALLPLWEEIRLPLLAPTELLAVESDGLIPANIMMRAFRTLHMMAWALPAAHIDSGVVDMHLWRRMPSEMEMLRSQTEARLPLRVPSAEAPLRAYDAKQQHGAVRLAEVMFWHGPLAFSLAPRITTVGGHAMLSFTLTHRPAPMAKHHAPRRAFEVGLLLPHAKGVCGVYDLLAPPSHEQPEHGAGAAANLAAQGLGVVPPQGVAMPPGMPPPPIGQGAQVAPMHNALNVGDGAYRVTMRGVRLADVLRRGHFLANGDLPLTVMLQEPMRDREAPLRRGRAKPFVHRPTSVQAWQYEKEQPPLIHWNANQGHG